MQDESHPTQIGPYEVRQIIGRGAMGVIYEAYDPEADQRLAIKTLPLDVITDKSQLDTLEMNLRHEAKIASKLIHPNIVQIYGEVRCAEEGDVFFVVMEYVDGINFSVRMKQGPLPLWELRQIMVQVCDGLNYAHDQQVIHRDVKPGNILLTSDLQAKITDFGIAKVQRRATTILFNQTGKMVGTPSYMSPEQVTDSKVDRRTDVFSLGCILYRVLTGKKPFTGKTIVDTLVKIVREPPLPPRHHQPKLSASLEELVLKCLEKEKGDRYQSTLELREDLLELLPPPPENRNLWSPEGETMVDDGDLVSSQVHKRLQEVVEEKPAVSLPASDLDWCLYRAERYVERQTFLTALHEVRKALALEPRHPRATDLLGEISEALEVR